MCNAVGGAVSRFGGVAGVVNGVLDRREYSRVRLANWLVVVKAHFRCFFGCLFEQPSAILI